MATAVVLLEVETEKESPRVLIGSARRLSIRGLSEGGHVYARFDCCGPGMYCYTDGQYDLPDSAAWVTARYVPNGTLSRVTVDLE